MTVSVCLENGISCQTNSCSSERTGFPLYLPSGSLLHECWTWYLLSFTFVSFWFVVSTKTCLPAEEATLPSKRWPTQSMLVPCLAPICQIVEFGSIRRLCWASSWFSDDAFSPHGVTKSPAMSRTGYGIINCPFSFGT